MRTPAPSAPVPARAAPADAVSELLSCLDRYAANFDLMLSAWKTRDIYSVVTDEYSTLLQQQKTTVPEASMVMVDVVLAHNDAVLVLVDLHQARAHRSLARYTERDLARRQEAHALAVQALRDHVLKKTH